MGDEVVVSVLVANVSIFGGRLDRLCLKQTLLLHQCFGATLAIAMDIAIDFLS